MVIKVLFFDTSALLKKFIPENGSDKVKWLTSPQTKVTYALYFVVNEQVCKEFESKIQSFAKHKRITENVAKHVLRQFANCHIRVIGQEIISNVKSETTLDAAIDGLNLKQGKDDWDALIYQSIVNALAYLGGQSHPILVTCDVQFAKKVMEKGYRVINPIKQSLDEIKAILEASEVGSA